jgi:hypothetical protein
MVDRPAKEFGIGQLSSHLFTDALDHVARGNDAPTTDK